MKDRDNWICTCCKWEGPVDDIVKTQVFIQTQEEPDEFLWYCPDCNRTDSLEEKYENAAWCRTCEDVIVPDEGEQCEECRTCQAEAWADEVKGH